MMTFGSCELLRRCAAGADDLLWNEFVTCFAGDLRAGVRGALRRVGLAGDRERVDDLVQEVYCRLLESDRARLRGFRGSHAGEASRFVGRLAANTALDALRTASAAKRGHERLVELEVCRGRREPLAPEADPEARLLAREGSLRVLASWREVIARATPRDGAIFRLAFAEGLTSRQIASRVGLTATGVDSVMLRLRRRLARAGVELPLRTRGRRAAGRGSVVGPRRGG